MSGPGFGSEKDSCRWADGMLTTDMDGDTTCRNEAIAEWVHDGRKSQSNSEEDEERQRKGTRVLLLRVVHFHCIFCTTAARRTLKSAWSYQIRVHQIQ